MYHCASLCYIVLDIIEASMKSMKALPDHYMPI